MHRRDFVSGLSLAPLVVALSPYLARGREAAPKILLRSSWQTVNIGDIAHTPGMLTLLEKHFPHAEVRLWPSNIGDGVPTLPMASRPRLSPPSEAWCPRHKNAKSSLGKPSELSCQQTVSNLVSLNGSEQFIHLDAQRQANAIQRFDRCRVLPQLDLR